MAAARFPSWARWGDLFNCIVFSVNGANSPSTLRILFVNTFVQLQSRPRRIPTADGRSRARRRRGLIRDMLRSYIECSLRWMQTGCLRLAEEPVGRSLRQLASRAAMETCCTSPLASFGDKRGRVKGILANIVDRTQFLVLFISAPGLHNGVTTEACINLRVHYAFSLHVSPCRIRLASSPWMICYRSRSLSRSLLPQTQTSLFRQVISTSPCISGGPWYDGW